MACVLLSKTLTVYVQLFTSEVATAFPTNLDFLWHQSTEYSSEVTRGEADECCPFNAKVTNVLSHLTLFRVVVLTSEPSKEGCRARVKKSLRPPTLPPSFFQVKN